MPRYPIDRATNFIVEEESWSVVEYDHTSVPGVIYLSLTEGKINSIYDDVENNIADTDKLAQYAIDLPDKIQIFNIGEEITPQFTLIKNGQPIEEEVQLLTTDKSIAKIIDGKLTAVAAGMVNLVVQLLNYPTIQLDLQVQVGGEEQEFTAYIEGNDTIKLDRIAEYTLKSLVELTENVIFELEDTKLATIINSKDNKCQIQANAKNQLGKIILHAKYNDRDYTKEISIIPLW